MKQKPQSYVTAMNSVYVFVNDNDLEMIFDDLKRPWIII